MKISLPNEILDIILGIYWYDIFKNSVIIEINKLNRDLNEIYIYMNKKFFRCNKSNDIKKKEILIHYNNLLINNFNYIPYKKIINYNNYSIKLCMNENKAISNIPDNLKIITNYAIMIDHFDNRFINYYRFLEI